jgi:hypothetical protein
MRLGLLGLLSIFTVVACSSTDAATPNGGGSEPDVSNERSPDNSDEDEDEGDPELTTLPDDPKTPGDAGIVPSGGNCVSGGLYCGMDKVIGDPNTLYKCNGHQTPTVLEVCKAGCTVNSGVNDSCAPEPGNCKIESVPEATYVKYGLHPDASDALARLSFPASRITQTIGSASASAGTHGQDGTAGGRAYSAATDLSVSTMTDAQVSVLLDELTSVGFVAYLRKPGHDGWPASEARHLHIIWVGAPMKRSLRDQVRDWRVGKNALASHTTYKFKTWSPCWRDAIWARYLTANPATN